MAFQQVGCVLTVMIALLCRGCDTQQAVCGRPVINNLINGSDPAPGRWPWVASIKNSKYDVSVGTLINNQWVLADANFKSSYAKSTAVVYLGVYNKSGSNLGQVSRTINKFVCTVESNAYVDFSACLLKLSAPVNFTDYIQPVCLASANSTFYEGVTSWFTGYSSNAGNVILKADGGHIVGNNKCACSLEGFFNILNLNPNTVKAHMMCSDPDGGLGSWITENNGAPLMARVDSVWVQIGIGTYLSFYAQPSPYIVFNKVSNFEKWINDTVSGTETGFVTFTSPGVDNDLTYSCSGQPPSTTTGYIPPTTPYTPPATGLTSPTTGFTPPTTNYPFNITLYTTSPPGVSTTTKDNSIFSGDEQLTHFTHLISILALALIFHVFVYSG